MRLIWDDADSRLINYYKDRNVYRAEFNRPWIAERSFEFKKVDKTEKQENFTVEMEHKLYPVDGVPDYCNKFPAWPYIDSFSGFLLPPGMLVNTYFFCRFKSESESYVLGQYLEKAGTYKLNIKAVTGPVNGKFLLTANDQEKTVDLYSDSYIYKDIPLELNFLRGMNYIRLRPLDVRDKGSYFIIDKLEFELLEK